MVRNLPPFSAVRAFEAAARHQSFKAAGEELCFGPLRERIRARVWPTIAEGVEVVPSALGADIADLAGICTALEAARKG